MTRWLRSAPVCALGILLGGCAQKSVRLALLEPPRQAADPFILTIETMKRSVAPVVCLDEGPKIRIEDREGTAFFISQAGAFLTAAHVLDEMRTHDHPCPVAAIYLPLHSWKGDTLEETVVWFPFEVSACVIQRALDVAKCATRNDLSVRRPGFSFEIRPVQLEFSDQADGTQIAFTGFPLGVRDPLTSRGGIAAYRASKDAAELVLDQTAWPGASGSPVYLSDGRVIGIMLARGVAEGTGITVVRPARSLQAILETETSHASRREQHANKPRESAGQ